MALHWSPDAAATLAGWQKGLKTGGKLFTALLVDGSFKEWRDLCAANNVPDGLWPLPETGFAGGIAGEIETQSIEVDYPSARDFLSRLKAIGAAAPRPGHKPFGATLMRRLLASATTPFAITYRVLYIEAPSVNSI
jgi:malonyl-CoA O-methyltransferase